MKRSGQDNDGGIVYSTEHGRMCPACSRPIAACGCRRAASPPAGDGTVRVGLERSGRKGKAVTVITGVPLDPEGLRALAKQMKERCGTGGTVKAGVIEIQGDHRDRVVRELQDQGYGVRRSGG